MIIRIRRQNCRNNSCIYLLAVLLFISGCSTISGRQNGYDTVHFDANQSQVEIVCAGQRIFTPGNLQLERSRSHSCIAQRKGFERQEFQIKARTGWKGFGASTGANFYFGLFTLGAGLVLGWVIDWSSGAMRNLKTGHYYLEMQPEGTTGTSMHVVEKVGDVVKTAVKLPLRLASETTKTIVDTTVQTSAEEIGLVKPDE